MNETLKVAKGAQTAPQPERSGWISVEDRLPPEDECVLGFEPWHEGGGWQCVVTQHNSFFTNEQRVGVDISHWMPLPATPAMDAKEE